MKNVGKVLDLGNEVNFLEVREVVTENLDLVIWKENVQNVLDTEVVQRKIKENEEKVVVDFILDVNDIS